MNDNNQNKMSSDIRSVPGPKKRLINKMNSMWHETIRYMTPNHTEFAAISQYRTAALQQMQRFAIISTAPFNHFAPVTTGWLPVQ